MVPPADPGSPDHKHLWLRSVDRTETADLERLAEEGAGQDVGKIRATVERYVNSRTRAMETIHSMLRSDAAEFRKALGRS